MVMDLAPSGALSSYLVRWGIPCSAGSSRRPCHNDVIDGGAKCLYHDYLASPAWAAKRRALIASLPKKECFCCGKPFQRGFHCHHVSYAHLGDEFLTDLRLVCGMCHRSIHTLQRKKRCTILAATNMVRRAKRAKPPARRRTRKPPPKK